MRTRLRPAPFTDCDSIPSPAPRGSIRNPDRSSRYYGRPHQANDLAAAGSLAATGCGPSGRGGATACAGLNRLVSQQAPWTSTVMGVAGAAAAGWLPPAAPVPLASRNARTAAATTAAARRMRRPRRLRLSSRPRHGRRVVCLLTGPGHRWRGRRAALRACHRRSYGRAVPRPGGQFAPRRRLKWGCW